MNDDKNNNNNNSNNEINKKSIINFRVEGIAYRDLFLYALLTLIT